MRYITLIHCLLSVLQVFAGNSTPNNLGLGLVFPTDPYQFEMLDTFPRFYIDQNLTKEFLPSEVSPMYFKPDYGLYHFKCIEKGPKYYKVYINDNQIGFLPNHKVFCFRSWDSMIQGTWVERISRQNEIWSECCTESRKLKNECFLDRLYVFEIVEVKNEYWAHISFSDACATDGDYDDFEYGWIQWRTEKELLVDLLLLC